MADDASPGARLVVIVLCMMVCAVPVAYPPGIYDYALVLKLFVLHLCIALICLGWLWQTRWGRDVQLISSPLLLPILCFMGVTLLSAPSTTHPLDTLVELLNQAALIALFFVVAHTLSLKRLRPVLWVNAATGLGVSLIGILQYHNLAFLDIPTNGPPSATFGYRNFAAMYLVCAIPLTGLLFFTVQRGAGLLLSGLSITLMGVYLVYTRTRSAWVGVVGALLCVGGVMAFWSGLRRPVWETLRSGLGRRKRMLALGLGVLFVFLSVLPPRLRDIGWQSDYYSKAEVSSTVRSIVEPGADKGRLDIWGVTLRLIADHPLLGVGPGGWVRAYPPYDRGTTITANMSFYSPHNDYLWMAAEYGLIGLGIYLYLLATAFRCLLSMARSPEHPPRIAALMIALSLLATMGDAFFNFPREWPQAALFPYLLFGVVAAATKGESGPHPPPFPHSPALPSEGGREKGREGFRGWVRSVLPYLLLAISLTAAAVSWRRIGFDRHYQRAMIWTVHQKDWKVILAEAQRALDYGVFRPHVLTLKGNALENLGRYSEAEAAFHQALVYTPHSWYAYNGFCSVYTKQGRLEEAISHGRSALSICPTYAETRNNLGVALMNKRDLDDAIQEYRQALQIKPDFAEAHNNLGLALAAKGDLDGAIQEYRQAVKVNPDYAKAHSNFGIALAAKGDLDGAIQEYRQALRIEPDLAGTHSNLGLALAAKRDLDGAIQEYRQALRLEPNLAEAHLNLGLALKDKRDLPQAIQEWRTYIRLSADEGRIQKVRELIRQFGATP